MRFVRAESREDVLTAVAEELRLSGVTTDMGDQVVADYLGLNRTDMRCLDIIARLDGVSAGRLALEARLSTGAVTTVLDRLERAGYAHRSADPDDRRRVLAVLTPEVRRELADLYAPLADATMRRLEGYSTDEISLVRDFLRDARRLHEEHADRVRGRQRFPQEGEAAS